jgi:Trk-type K+ transport system membrane component
MATGGFSTRTASVAAFDSVAIELIYCLVYVIAVQTLISLFMPGGTNVKRF